MIEIDIAPTLFEIGGFMLAWHSVFTLIPVVMAVYLIGRWAVSNGFSDDVVPSVAMWAIPGGIVGARLVHVVDNWSYYAANPSLIPAIWSGGIAIYGALAGGLVAGATYAALKGIPVRRLLDIAAPALILGQAVGRIGDLINGEHFSTSADLPWSIVYTNPASPGYGRPPSHPAVGYEMLADLLLFGLLYGLRGRLRPDGSLFTLYALGYAAIRLPLSFLRLDSYSAALGMNQQGWISLLVLLAASATLVILKPRLAHHKQVPANVHDG